MNDAEKKINPIETNTSTVYLLEGNIVLNEEKEDSVTTLKDAIDKAKIINKIHSEGKWGLIVDLRKSKSITKEARDFFAQPEQFPNGIGIALLTGSYFSKVLANFYLGFSKPIMPSRLFTSKIEAIRWLKERIKNGN